MHNRRNYYRILHVQPDAPDEIIRASYRTLMTKLRRHPDLGGDHYTAMIINEAYSVLSDRERRAVYDHSRAAVTASRALAPEAAASPSSFSESDAPVLTCQFCGAMHGFSGQIHATATCTTCNTPLAPAVRERLDAGQRAVARVPRRLALKYFVGWPAKGSYPGETRDLSLHGLRFVTQSAVGVAKLLKVECEALTALVRVVACDDNTERDWRWLVRAEYITVRFRRIRGGFFATRG